MRKILLFLLFVGFFVSCSDLKEEILDETLNSDLLDGSDAADGILAPVYSRMNLLFNYHETYFLLQEISTDEAMVPYRGGTDWYNGGVLIETYKHTWSSGHDRIKWVWELIVQGIARAVAAMNTFTDMDSDKADLYYAEARAMAAFYNYTMLDLWGIAFVKDPENIHNESTVLYKEEAFDYIMSELDAVYNILKTKSEVGAGRFTKGAVLAVKARMYLNKPFYTDPYATTFSFSTDDMNKVINLCDDIIEDTGNYGLESEDYFKIFDMDNHNHSEHIFAMDMRDDVNGNNYFPWFALARNQYCSLENHNSTGTDGASITSDFYYTWSSNMNDPRFYKEVIPQDGSVTSVKEAEWGLNRGILQGQQYGIVLDGSDFKRTPSGNLVIEKLYNTKATGEAVNFTVEIDLETHNGHSAGARVLKNEYDPACTDGRNRSRVDQVLIRLGEVYLIRAEAKLRSGNTQGALADINTLRSARNHPTMLTNISLEALYNERGYELYWEMVRRTDMIRFGKFENSYTSKNNSDITRRLFPIPQTAMDANPKLLTQNEGY